MFPAVMKSPRKRMKLSEKRLKVKKVPYKEESQRIIEKWGWKWAISISYSKDGKQIVKIHSAN